ncbi:hypothetical protein LMH73_024875 [Vibrio splendidus]|nr:hypothetical protein [Vibrio splendidus]MCC4881464.1 hypothetical protein [Vibrio splendidus]
MLSLIADSRLSACYDGKRKYVLQASNTAHAVFMRGGSGDCYQVLIPIGLLISLDKLRVITGESELLVDYRFTNHYYGYDLKRVEPVVGSVGLITIIDTSLSELDMFNIKFKGDSQSPVSEWVSVGDLRLYFSTYAIGDIAIRGIQESLLSPNQLVDITNGFPINDSDSHVADTMLPLLQGLRDEIEVLKYSGISRADITDLCVNSLVFYCNVIKYISRTGIELTVLNASPLVVCDLLSDESLGDIVDEMMAMKVVDCPELTHYISRKEQSVHMINAVIDGIEAMSDGTFFNKQYTQEMRMLARTFNFIELAIASKLGFSGFLGFIDHMTVNQHHYQTNIMRSVFGIDMETLLLSFCRSSGFSESMLSAISKMADDTLLTGQFGNCRCLKVKRPEICPSIAVRLIAHLLNEKGYILEPTTELDSNEVNDAISRMAFKDVLLSAVSNATLRAKFKPLEHAISNGFNCSQKEKGRIAF